MQIASHLRKVALVALVAGTALIVDPVGANAFELPKSAWLRMWAFVGFIGLLGVRFVRGSRLHAYIVAWLGAQALATAASIDPAGSALGLGLRAQGLANALGFAAVFWLAASRHNETTARTVFRAIALGSAPVCGLGLWEWAQGGLFGPITRFGGRIASTLGNPTLLGDYLVLAIPATCALAMGANSWSFRALWMGVIAGQVVCLGLSGARAAWIGGLVGATVALGCFGYRSKRPALIWCGPLALAIAAWIALEVNVPGSWLYRFRNVPVLRRLAVRGDLAAGGGFERVRPTVWRACLRLARGETSVAIGPHALMPLRLFVGYGPETLRQTFWTVFPASLIADEGRRVQVDRAHNMFVDALVETGLVGVLTTLALWVFFFRATVLAIVRGATHETARLGVVCLCAGSAHFVAAQAGPCLTVAKVLTFTYMGLIASQIERRPKRDDDQSPESLTSVQRPRMPWAQKALALLLLAASWVAAMRTVQWMLADVQLAQAKWQRTINPVSAVSHCIEATRLFPLDARPYRMLAQLYFDMARAVRNVKGSDSFRSELLRRALRAVRVALEREPFVPAHYDSAARICAELSRRGDRQLAQRAVAYWHRGIAICPTCPVLWENLGEFYEAQNDLNRALECFDRARRVDPYTPSIYCRLAEIWLRLGRFDVAKGAARNALLVSPNYAPAQRLLKRIEARLATPPKTPKSRP